MNAKIAKESKLRGTIHRTGFLRMVTLVSVSQCNGLGF